MDEFKRKMKMDMMVKDFKIKMLSLPYIGNKQKVMLEKKRLKMLAVSLDINTDVIGYFRVKKELPRVDKLLSLVNYLDKEEAELFDVDVRKIDLIFHAK